MFVKVFNIYCVILFACEPVFQDDLAMVRISMELYIDSVDIIQAPRIPFLLGRGVGGCMADT